MACLAASIKPNNVSRPILCKLNVGRARNLQHIEFKLIIISTMYFMGLSMSVYFSKKKLSKISNKLIYMYDIKQTVNQLCQISKKKKHTNLT